MMNRTILSLAVVGLLALSPGVSLADEPDGTITYTGGSAALGIGFSWGQGILHFKGMDYPFKVNGLSIADVGASKIQATGTVWHLSSIEQFPGNYTAAKAGVTVAGGGGGTAMQNQNGVVIQMGATTQGLQFTLAPSGIAIALEGSPTPMAGSSSPSK